MPRELGRGGYSAQAVYAALTSDACIIDQRFTLVDRSYNFIDTLDVTAASVEWNATREIPRALRFSMLPRSDLLDVPFRYLVKPYFSLGMPDGGTAEFPMGAYPFTIPARDIEENAALGSGSSDTAGDGVPPANPETWDLTLGDQMHYLTAGGVGPTGFQVAAGTEWTEALIKMLGRLNISDFSGIAASDAVAAQAVNWTLRRGAQRWRGWVPTALEDQSTSWAAVASEIHAQLGYNPPGFDLDQDRYVAQPAVDLAALQGAPVISYEPGQDSLLLPGVRVTPDLSKLGNRATVTQSAAGGVSTVAVVDLNDLIPGHPLSEGVAGFYMELTATSPGGSTYPQLLAQAKTLLYEAVKAQETVSAQTLGGVQHDAWEIVALRVPGDPIFDVPQLCAERQYSFDLFTGVSSHEWQRLAIPATPQ